jgi:phospholipid/cholesterol/gamma-HCH transport system substrate-binding protein
MQRQPDSPSAFVPANFELKAVLLLVLMACLIAGFLLYVMYARGASSLHRMPRRAS